ncbi:MAG TPA: (2Fe-2S)-binding protein [Falsiroseomonas sp.]|nr:(2Fe-2S)-binding protein [Falsiroseomonas sp.]
MPAPLLHRLLDRQAPPVPIRIDGEPAEAFEGESLLVVMLTHGAALRRHEADGAPRAGFCLMGACQDCWVWLPDGRRLRACTTHVTAGMEVLTRAPEPARHG